MPLCFFICLFICQLRYISLSSLNLPIEIYLYICLFIYQMRYLSLSASLSANWDISHFLPIYHSLYLPIEIYHFIILSAILSLSLSATVYECVSVCVTVIIPYFSTSLSAFSSYNFYDCKITFAEDFSYLFTLPLDVVWWSSLFRTVLEVILYVNYFFLDLADKYGYRNWSLLFH